MYDRLSASAMRSPRAALPTDLIAMPYNNNNNNNSSSNSNSNESGSSSSNNRCNKWLRFGSIGLIVQSTSVRSIDRPTSCSSPFCLNESLLRNNGSQGDLLLLLSGLLKCLH
ncbi:putative uncharacterized protein DDB_G0286333 [Drosophila navojoa]|uniref:putative uncharacterized protein DDB_G0286333 n=1 Tax=Drosophila navojoa TaxID=7232 RepID=UPI000847B1C9|nr:putative uncharacterized protein DDB_G0286333 [Drosophila navojoa]